MGAARGEGEEHGSGQTSRSVKVWLERRRTREESSRMGCALARGRPEGEGRSTTAERAAGWAEQVGDAAARWRDGRAGRIRFAAGDGGALKRRRRRGDWDAADGLAIK